MRSKYTILWIVEYFVQYCNLAFIHDGLEVLIKYIKGGGRGGAGGARAPPIVK